MSRSGVRAHVVRVRKRHVTKSGEVREYSSAYLRRSYRDNGVVRKQTLADLSALPDHVVDTIEAGLKGTRLVSAGEGFTITRSLPHGDAAAVWAMAKKLGLPALLGPAGRSRDIVMALVVSRVLRPGSKLSTLSWWDDTTLGADFGVAGASTGEVYAAMDWLVTRQDPIEKKLAAKYLAPEVNPSRMALFDLSSSWVTGQHCELAARGYSRDGKKGCEQIEYGLLTNPDGIPVGVRVFPGNTADPAAFTDIVDVLRNRFGLDRLVLVGDRGMITTARITALRELDENGCGFDWVTALRAPAIAKLAAADGPLQMSLFDQQDLVEITHPDYPGERLIACRNPVLAEERARKRRELLDATETDLAAIVERVGAGRLVGAAAIGRAVGKMIGKRKVGKHFRVEITDTGLTVARDQPRIDTEAALDGVYVIRTSTPADELDSTATVAAYKNLSKVERDFRVIKVDDLDLRPIHHRLEDRVKAHVVICMLACYLVWHLRKAWAPLTFTDEHPPERVNPVAPARRSSAADTKASFKTGPGGQPVRSFRSLLAHLATLSRNTIHHTTGIDVPMLTDPTPDQQQAFDLIDTPIPLTLT